MDNITISSPHTGIIEKLIVYLFSCASLCAETATQSLIILGLGDVNQILLWFVHPRRST